MLNATKKLREEYLDPMFNYLGTTVTNQHCTYEKINKVNPLKPSG
jgi:hypothetical protein